jgi:uncharacterized protein GlcG (DUF336 family)
MSKTILITGAGSGFGKGATIGAARVAAVAIGVPMNIAVYADGANLKALARMDGALLGSLDSAMGKPRTAALFGFNTEAAYDFCKPGGTSPGFENSNGGLVVFAGGIPIRDAERRLVGAVGVSGGAVARDLGVAESAAIGRKPPESSPLKKNIGAI